MGERADSGLAATPRQTEPPDFVAAAKAFGLLAERADSQEQVAPAVRRALDSGQPALVEVQVQRKFPYSGSNVVGWWDVPVPAYLKARRTKYEKARAQKQPRPARPSRTAGRRGDARKAGGRG